MALFPMSGPGNRYAGMCVFKDEVQKLFKWDTVASTGKDGDASSSGEGGFDSACSRHLAVLPEILDNPSIWCVGYKKYGNVW